MTRSCRWEKTCTRLGTNTSRWSLFAFLTFPNLGTLGLHSPPNRLPLLYLYVQSIYSNNEYTPQHWQLRPDLFLPCAMNAPSVLERKDGWVESWNQKNLYPPYTTRYSTTHYLSYRHNREVYPSKWLHHSGIAWGRKSFGVQTPLPSRNKTLAMPLLKNKRLDCRHPLNWASIQS